MQGELFLCFFFAIYRVALKVNKMYDATVHHYFMLLLFSYINVKGNQKWTIQRNWQQDTRRRQTKQINVREYRRSNQKWTIQRNWQHSVQTKQINVREYRRSNQKWTIQRNWQHRVHKTKTNKTNKR